LGGLGFVILTACLTAGCHTLLPLSEASDSAAIDDSGGSTVKDQRVGEPPMASHGCAALPPGSKSDVYTVDPDGPGGADPFLAYCEMVADGGGWTLVLKADGNKPTWHFSGELWTNTGLLNPDKPGLDQTEAKLAGFNSMPFTELRLGMIDGGETRWITVKASGTSLHDVFKTVPAGERAKDESTIVKTGEGRAEWFKLLAAPSLQEHCDREGLNNDDGHGSRVRIGIIANNEQGCGDTDSWIGFGGAEDWCAVKINATVGNGHCRYWQDKTLTDHATFGYVMIR
jgi:hypothetical protein